MWIIPPRSSRATEESRSHLGPCHREPDGGGRGLLPPSPGLRRTRRLTPRNDRRVCHREDPAFAGDEAIHDRGRVDCFGWRLAMTGRLSSRGSPGVPGETKRSTFRQAGFARPAGLVWLGRLLPPSPVFGGQVSGPQRASSMFIASTKRASLDPALAMTGWMSAAFSLGKVGPPG